MAVVYKLLIGGKILWAVKFNEIYLNANQKRTNTQKSNIDNKTSNVNRGCDKILCRLWSWE